MIRLAGEEDLDAIKLIARITWSQAYENKIPETVQEKFIERYYEKSVLLERINNDELIVVTDDDLIVGYAFFSVREGLAKILALFVLPTSQRIGFGTRLLDYLLQFVRIKADVAEVRLEAQTQSAINFYEKNGFERKESEFFEIEGYPLKQYIYQKEIK